MNTFKLTKHFLVYKPQKHGELFLFRFHIGTRNTLTVEELVNLFNSTGGDQTIFSGTAEEGIVYAQCFSLRIAWLKIQTMQYLIRHLNLLTDIDSHCYEYIVKVWKNKSDDGGMLTETVLFQPARVWILSLILEEMPFLSALATHQLLVLYRSKSTERIQQAAQLQCLPPLEQQATLLFLWSLSKFIPL